MDYTPCSLCGGYKSMGTCLCCENCRFQGRLAFPCSCPPIYQEYNLQPTQQFMGAEPTWLGEANSTNAYDFNNMAFYQCPEVPLAPAFAPEALAIAPAAQQQQQARQPETAPEATAKTASPPALTAEEATRKRGRPKKAPGAPKAKYIGRGMKPKVEKKSGPGRPKGAKDSVKRLPKGHSLKARKKAYRKMDTEEGEGKGVEAEAAAAAAEERRDSGYALSNFEMPFAAGEEATGNAQLEATPQQVDGDFGAWLDQADLTNVDFSAY